MYIYICLFIYIYIYYIYMHIYVSNVFHITLVFHMLFLPGNSASTTSISLSASAF